jgi:bifunctional ADP-heptose synthase (sugar kinase/adenylyltransferase)
MHAPSSTEALGPKYVALPRAPELRRSLRDAGQRLVHCHGVFDVLHPGNVRQLQEARALGDRLLVSVAAGEDVEGRAAGVVFPHDLRMATLAALACVDFVMLAEEGSAIAVIDAIQPDVYCEGVEEAEQAEPRADSPTAERVRHWGGQVCYLSGTIAGSTELLTEHLDVLPFNARKFTQRLARHHGLERVKQAVEAMAGLRVLVVGEVIIDEYVTCTVQGVTGKDRVPSVRHLSSQRQWGGAYAVARHLAPFCGQVSIAGIAGPGEDLTGPLPPTGTPEAIVRAFEEDPVARTVLKRRYVAQNRLRAELSKVFSVNDFNEPDELDPATRSRFRARLRDLMAAHDMVVLTDYGHGLLDQETMDLIQDEASYLALNCQTNSANFGYNLITKYRRADTFCLDEGELTLAFSDRHGLREPLLAALRAHLCSGPAWLTLGAAGSLAIGRDDGVCRAPALTLHVKDTLGAGDAFFALASACARLDEPLEIGSLLGNIAGALAANVVGNTEAIKRADVLNFASRVLAR